MIAELALANSAFAVIKKTIQNGREILDAGEAISKFVSAKEELREKGTSRKNSIYHSLKGTQFSDLEEFMALEKIKKQEEELREFMMLYGRPNLYTDYVKFCAEARKKRKERIELARKNKEELIESLAIGTLIVMIASIIIFFLWLYFSR